MRNSIQLTQKNIIYLSIVFTGGLIILAWLISAVFMGRPPGVMFQHGSTVPVQLAGGLIFGAAAGALSTAFLIYLPPLQELRGLFLEIIKRGRLTVPVILFISISAGVSEEILFRGCFQELIGILLSSLLFVALHGYLNPLNWRISIYGLLMFAVSIGLGLLYKWAGLLAAMSAHAAVDVVILWGLRAYYRIQ